MFVSARIWSLYAVIRARDPKGKSGQPANLDERCPLHSCLPSRSSPENTLQVMQPLLVLLVDQLLTCLVLVLLAVLLALTLLRPTDIVVRGGWLGVRCSAAVSVSDRVGLCRESKSRHRSGQRHEGK